jgi:hypothetical protein
VNVKPIETKIQHFHSHCVSFVLSFFLQMEMDSITHVLHNRQPPNTGYNQGEDLQDDHPLPYPHNPMQQGHEQPYCMI